MKRNRSIGILASVFAVALMIPGMAVAQDDYVGDPFALNVCVVSGEAIGAGDPVLAVHDGRQVRFCCAGCVSKFSADPVQFIAKMDKMMIKQQEAHYPLTTCVVSGKELTADMPSKIVNNRLMKFCCENCPKSAAATPAKFIAKLDEAIIVAQSETYTLKTCPVSGKELGSMGDAINIVVANRLIKICCAGCEKPVLKQPAKMIALVDGKKFDEGSNTK